MNDSPSILLKNGSLIVHDDNDNVVIKYNSDILIEEGIISRIGKGIEAKEGVLVIECSGKIISPGFIDTHHHVWQMQLKGRHSDDTLVEYHPKGNLQFYNYSPEDIFWGELGGLMEAIDGGTTCLVDHAHMSLSPDHVLAGLSATSAVGIRSVFCYSLVPRIEKWDTEVFKLASSPIPDWFLPGLEKLCSRREVISSDRVTIGLGFDSYHIPEGEVSKVFRSARDFGVELITSHWRRCNVAGMTLSVPMVLNKYGLLEKDILISHGTGSTKEELQLLSGAGVYVSCTPGTESQMAHGSFVDFESGTLGSLGADCESSNPSSMLHAMQLYLALTRSRRNSEILARGKFPRMVRPKTLAAFNLATIGGARAINRGDSLGRLQEGRKADIIIINTESPAMTCAFDHDPLVAVVRHAGPSDIETVIVGGRVLKVDGKLLDVPFTDLKDWTGSKNVTAVMKSGRLAWNRVAHQLRASRNQIQERVNCCDIELAKADVLVTWGTTNKDKVLE